MTHARFPIRFSKSAATCRGRGPVQNANRFLPEFQANSRHAGGVVAFICCAWLAGPAVLAAPESPAASPRVFLLDGGHLAAARERVRSGETALRPALRKLEQDASAAMKLGPF